MKVVWSKLATYEVRKTNQYIRNTFGMKTAQSFMSEIQHTDFLLSQMPYIGKKEPYMEDLPKEIRSLVVASLNKIVYYVEGDVVTIIDFWNLRQSPETLVNRAVSNLRPDDDDT